MFKLIFRLFHFLPCLACCLMAQNGFAQVSQSPIPVEGVYPGRCPERVGSSVPNQTYIRFTCSGIEDGFSLNNYGPNRIVPAPAQENDLYPARDFYFNYPGRHRQEMHLLLVDWPSEWGPDVRISKLYFFPRLVVPSVKPISLSQYQVTLPNLDKVNFSVKSHEIDASAFAERPMNLKAYSQNPALFAGVNYQSQLPGDTVLVRVDRKGPASFLSGFANITKQCSGVVCGRCKVPSAEIFRDTSSEFRFSDDSSFYAYLRARCGFRI